MAHNCELMKASFILLPVMSSHVAMVRYNYKVFRIEDELYKCSSIDDGGKINLKDCASTTGKMYELKRIHRMKDIDVPLWVISSTIGTHNFNLSKFLVTLLDVISRSVYTLKDSFLFASEIIKARNDNMFMANFEVVSLFTNIQETGSIIFDSFIS